MSKTKINDFFSKIDEPTLVISAYNIHIFSNKVLTNNNLLIVNFHNSLLPKHRGRNSPTWTIYEMDKFAGVTWHLITNEIDKGEIIEQMSFRLDDNLNAIELSELCLDIGLKSFKKMVIHLLNNDFKSSPVKMDPKGKIRHSSEIPNNGIYNFNWSLKKGYAFLRSLDYRIYPIFPKPSLYLSNKKFDIIEYKFLDKKEVPKDLFNLTPFKTFIQVEGDNCLRMDLTKSTASYEK